MCIQWIKNLFMADTKVHGGLDINFTKEVQFSSQMSNYALVNHIHTDYLNVSESGSVCFINANNIYFSSSVSSNSTSIYASAIFNTVPIVGHNIFINSNGHSFSSSVDGLSTFHWILTQ